MHFLQEFTKSHSPKIIIFISSTILIIYLTVSFILVSKTNSKLPHYHLNLQDISPLEDISSATSLDHIVFGIASNKVSWNSRKEFVRLWWKPKQMRGCVFLDYNRTSSDQDDQDDLLPPLCMSADTSRFLYTYRGGLRSAIRVARVVSETVALNHTNVRWFVFADDDTVFFPENLVKVLSKYDHELWYYIGSNSESFTQNRFFSFNMAYGGAGFAISYPLAKVLAKTFDSCIERYPYLYGSDGRISACLAELGVTLTKEPGFHQVDMKGDVFGLLAAHPVAPLISLHHLDIVNPIFPYMPSSLKALEHLYEAAKHDPHRIIQQTVCYDVYFSWTVSVSWGYAVQVYARNVPLPYLLRAQRTFRPFKRGRHINNNFNLDMREYESDRCRRAVVFYMDQVSSEKDEIQSVYRNNILQSRSMKLIHANCSRIPASPLDLQEIRVYSNKFDPSVKQEAGSQA
ncbi:uncharacterized protein LOC141720997 isoform X2 [Apium graveolens]|uniref:uncharacterized protein LOC141720997 isoform X2 n=1 Tax=Apium graveolens TaxID=4045 RepID=UPI003D7B4AD3